MGRIRILSDNVANKIAAGEVVERPSSVVKELLENSLDAGAQELRIECESGGKRLIRIADDGAGMLRDDALLAFERHATSKLSDVKDLDAIATLGFRGEALPSIASVSRLLLETRAAEETTGTRVEIAGGKLLKVDEAALTRGTTITVRDLFFNVPARRKFLRSEPTELAHIASLVTHYALAHPDKSFTLTHESSELLAVTPAPTLRDRVFQVFGSRVLDDLIEIGERTAEADGRRYRLRGFLSRPQVQKTNRNSIYLFVNGRLIRDKLLVHALTSGYANVIPPGTWPFALLFVDCDPEEVDVNVHPAKTEVRFRNGSFLHDFVRDAIRDQMAASRPVSVMPQPAAGLPYSEFTQHLLDGPQVQMEMPPASALPEVALPPWNLRPVSPVPQAARFEFTPATPPVRLPVPDTHVGFPAGMVEEAASLDALKDLRPLGQLHDSFIIAAGRDGLWLIDQHVAHERILFEQVLRASESNQAERQSLLLPIILPLTPAQDAEYPRIAEELERMGFEIEPFGQRTLAVKAAPAGIAAGEIERVLFEVLEIADQELRKATIDEIRRGVAATVACRAAIKINMPLDMVKMQWLLAELAKCELPMSCPHGRPIALRYSLREILRSFHRI